MKAYRSYFRVSDTKQVVLADLPFQPGQVVEVLVLAQDDERVVDSQRLDRLFETTQALSQLQTLTDDEIAAEIVAYRSEQ